MRDGILRENGNTIGIDHFRNTVVDFRIDMVRASSQNDSPLSSGFHVSQSFLSLAADIISHVLQFLPCGVSSGGHFLFGKIGKFFHKTLGGNFLIGERQKWVAERNGRIIQLIHVIFDIFRVRGYDRTVIMVDGIGKFCSLVRNTRVEDEFDALFDQPGNVSVSQFGRVTFGFAGDRFNTQLVNLSGGGG